jgi:hypothetical protein
MKTTAANPNATTQQQTRGSRQNTESGAATAAQKSPGSSTNAASSSQRATERAKRGEPLNAENKRDRSPKQENL